MPKPMKRREFLAGGSLALAAWLVASAGVRHESGFRRPVSRLDI